MDDKDYEIILSLYKTQNITKTAEQLFLTQPAVTIRLKNIERELCTQILIRTSKGIYFTPLGEKIAEYICKITENIEDMKDYINRNLGHIGGNLKVGVPMHYARHTLPRKLERYILDCPNVTVNIVTGLTSALYRLLTYNELNCTLVRGEYAWEEEKILLDVEPICLACSDEDARKNLDNLTYIDRTTDSILGSQIYRWLEENHLAHQTKLHIDDIETCQQLVGIGAWLIAPQLSLQGFEGYMEPLIMADGTPLLRKTYLLCRSFYIQLPQVQLFVEYLQHH